jgi:hypothetical protein
MARSDDASDEPLKRLGGGRWQTRDERFTIEPQSGTWVVVDAEQTDDLGLPLVRGPFPSLTAAKEAIASARASEPATSPLAGRLARGGDGATAKRAAKPARSSPAGKPRADDEPEPDRPNERTEPARSKTGKASRGSTGSARPATGTGSSDDAPAEPAWIRDLAAADRGRARRLIARLAEVGVSDAEGTVRRDLVGGVPAIAATAIARRLEALGPDADPAAVVEALAEGRDDELDVRWRIVDGAGRPITVEAPGRRRRR